MIESSDIKTYAACVIYHTCDIMCIYIFACTASHRGSISAEHGLGFKKAQFIYRSKSQVAVDYMKHLKKLFDPKAILNPYKTLPSE